MPAVARAQRDPSPDKLPHIAMRFHERFSVLSELSLGVTHRVP